MKILDCTLRDGGYYTNWDFNEDLTNSYFKLVKDLPIDIVEVGYRGNKNKKSYLGEYYFLTIDKIQKIKKIIGKKKISIMIDLKDWNDPIELKKNITDCKNLVNMIRFAIDPRKIEKSKNFLKITKKLGFVVAANLMYSHLLLENDKLISNIEKIKKYVDIFYIVDSYGSFISGDVSKIINKLRTRYKRINLGFHSHNNLELALSNSVEAMNLQINYLDCTFSGMGRGAGNLRTELLLSYLGIKKKVLKINNLNNIGKVIEMFEILKEKEKWGSSLPYMVSGSTNTAQGKVMQLIKSKRYNMQDIISSLFNKNKYLNKINKTLNITKKRILIIGGGSSVRSKKTYLNDFLKLNSDIYVIFSSSRNLQEFDINKNKSIVCITGNEINKISNSKLNRYNFLINDKINIKTIIPKQKTNFSRLKKNICNKEINDSPLAISLAAALEIKAKEIYLAGFDGFEKTSEINNYNLFNENQKIFDFYQNRLNLIFITDTKYEVKNKSSIYKYLK